MTRDRIAVSPHDALSTSVPGTTPRRVLRAIGAGPLNFEQRIQAAVAGGVLPVVGARTKEQMVGHIDGTALTLDDEQIAWVNAATSIELGVPDEMSSNPTGQSSRGSARPDRPTYGHRGLTLNPAPDAGRIADRRRRAHSLLLGPTHPISTTVLIAFCRPDRGLDGQIYRRHPYPARPASGRGQHRNTTAL